MTYNLPVQMTESGTLSQPTVIFPHRSVNVTSTLLINWLLKQFVQKDLKTASEA